MKRLVLLALLNLACVAWIGVTTLISMSAVNRRLIYTLNLIAERAIIHTAP